MKFEYSDAPQLSPEWFKLRRGKVTASKLEEWLSVSKAKATEGKPLKKRLDYEKELMFERQFDTSFETYVNSAMQDGIDYEDFARQQYEKIKGATCMEVGCWYNDYFVASPDRAVGERGLLEIKIVKDNTFTEILVSGVPPKHWKQIQGQLFASGKMWCDYVVLNFNTKKVIIIRVFPDPEFFDYLELALQEELVTEEFKLDEVYDIIGELPEGAVEWSGSEVDASDSNLNGGW
jgi:predicted phage-related endonuclease